MTAVNQQARTHEHRTKQNQAGRLRDHGSVYGRPDVTAGLRACICVDDVRDKEIPASIRREIINRKTSSVRDIEAERAGGWIAAAMAAPVATVGSDGFSDLDRGGPPRAPRSAG